MSKRALIIVDLQNDYFEGGKWELVGTTTAADNTAKLLAAARTAGETIIHIQHFFPESGPFFIEGTEGANIHTSVLPTKDEMIIEKRFPNSFQETTLKAVLDKANIEDVTICGAMSHMCIDATARAASDFGYKTTVIHDACASRDLEFNETTVPAAQVHAAFMSPLGFAYANVISTNTHLDSAA